LALISFLSTAPVLAQSSPPPCDPGIAETPAEWKQHFPFDLIFPDSGSLPPSVDPASECPVINFLGVDREVCTIKTLTAIVKNVFFFKIIIQGLFQL
jgi:hypothetical protein